MKCGQKGQRASLKEKPVILKFLYTEEAQKTRRVTCNYRFDWLALTGMGFTMTEDLAKANVIVGSQKLSDEALGAVNPGTPGETGKPSAPKTGDTGNSIVWVLAASFTVAMIPVTVTLKRKSR